MRSAFYALAAIVAGAVPRRHWAAIDLPISQFATLGGMVTFLTGCGLGITGYFAHMEQVMASAFFVPSAYMMTGYFGYLFFTPRGLFSMYLVFSGVARAVSGWIDEPFGDPVLTGVDSAIHRARGTAATRAAQRARLAEEGADEPDRRYTGDWADLPGVDYVIAAARRKPGWTAGTFVITDEGWFRLGQPFDRPTPNGLRTIYPLTTLRTFDVLRKGVSYQLPPLRPHPPIRRRRPAEPPEPRGES